MLGLSKSMVTCSIVGDAYENRWWYIALLVGYKATAEHYRGSDVGINARWIRMKKYRGKTKKQQWLPVVKMYMYMKRPTNTYRPVKTTPLMNYHFKCKI